VYVVSDPVLASVAIDRATFERVHAEALAQLRIAMR